MNQDQLQLRDIHPPVMLPEDPNYALFIGGIAAFLIVVAFSLLVFRLRKKGVILPFP